MLTLYLWLTYGATVSSVFCTPGVASLMTPWTQSRIEAIIFTIYLALSWRLQYRAVVSFDFRAFGETPIESPRTWSSVSGRVAERFRHQKRIETEDIVDNQINVLIKMMDGAVRVVRVHSTKNVSDLAHRIQCVANVPVRFQLLSFGGQLLKDSQTLMEAGVKDGSVITLSIRLRGGVESDEEEVRHNDGTLSRTDLEEAQPMHLDFSARIEAKNDARQKLDAIVKALSDRMQNDEQYWTLHAAYRIKFTALADELTALANYSEELGGFDETVSLLQELEEIDEQGLAVEDLCFARLIRGYKKPVKAIPFRLEGMPIVTEVPKIVVMAKAHRIPVDEAETKFAVFKEVPATESDVIRETECLHLTLIDQKARLAMIMDGIEATRKSNNNGYTEMTACGMCASQVDSNDLTVILFDSDGSKVAVATVPGESNDSQKQAMTEVGIANVWKVRVIEIELITDAIANGVFNAISSETEFTDRDPGGRISKIAVSSMEGGMSESKWPVY